MQDRIFSLFTNTIFYTWIGALSGHILSLYSKEFQGTKPFLQKILPNRSDTLYFRIDFLILPVIGALLAYVLLEPSNLKTSIFAGLSWSGALTALLQKSAAGISKEGQP